MSDARGRKVKERSGIGAKIYELRKSLGLNLALAADRWGTTVNKLSDYERGKRRIPVEVLCRIADRESITADWLLGRTDEWRMQR